MPGRIRPFDWVSPNPPSLLPAWGNRESRVQAPSGLETPPPMLPHRAIAYCNLGDALLKSGEKGKARKAFETYLELAPKGPNAAHVREALRQL